jgi:serine phosphatase RsbU (regulator of sigma subunit)
LEWLGTWDLLSSWTFAFAIIQFTRSFLNTRHYFPKTDRFFRLLLLLIALTIIPGFFGSAFIGNNLSSLLGLVTFATIMAVSIRSYRRKHPSAGYFLLAFSCFMLGVVVFLFASLGVLRGEFWMFSMQIGTSLELLLFSFALGNRINLLRADNERQQQEIIRQLRVNEEYQLKANQELEVKVKERTAELMEKNEEIAQQNEELATQAYVLETNSVMLRKQHAEIRGSINYAKRIQQAMLASESAMASSPGSFYVYYRPRDVISGDCYWFHQFEDTGMVAWATCDCTGHGVPGALMSMIAISMLNEVVRERKIQQPALVLEQLRRMLIQSLKQDASHENEQRDSIDMSFCLWDPSSNRLQYAGAKSPVWVFRGDACILAEKCDVQTVGIYGKTLRPFTDYTFQLEPGDRIYTFSDGVPDQFGGEKGTKFGKKQLRELLQRSASIPLAQQQEWLQVAIQDWMAQDRQTDDMLLIAVEV